MPHFAEAHSNLGLLYGELGKRDAAAESFRKAIAIKPGLAWAHSNLGNILTAQGKLPAAIESYRNALAIDPNHVETWVNLANTLYAQDDVDAAVEGYRKALAIKPDHALAWLNIGAPLQAQGNLDAAIESFRKALSLRPDFAEAHSGLLFLLSFDPEYSPAQRLAEAQRYGAAVMARAKPYDRWTADADVRTPTPARCASGWSQEICGRIRSDSLSRASSPTSIPRRSSWWPMRRFRTKTKPRRASSPVLPRGTASRN